MDQHALREFYSSVTTAGAILAGFSGTFLSFRIQRESNYYRQVSIERGEARDVYIGLSHFTSSFMLIICSTILSLVFRFLLPLFGLVRPTLSIISPGLVVAGLVAALIFLVGYFWAELVHYQILSRRLLHDKAEWGRQWPLVITTFALALFCFVSAYLVLLNV